MGLFKPNIKKLVAKKNVEQLIKALRNKNIEIRKNAVLALGELKAVESINPLINSFKDSSLQKTIVDTLINIDNAIVIKELSKAIEKNENNDVRKWSVITIGKINEPSKIKILVKALGDNDQDVREAAVRILLNISNQAVIDEVVKVIKNKNTNLRENAIKILSEIKNYKVVDTFIQVLEDKESSIRKLAINSIEKIRDPIAIKHLEKVLITDKVKEVRVCAIKALAGMEDSKATDGITKALMDKNKNVQELAINLLAGRGDSHTIKSLISLLGVDEEIFIDNIKKTLIKIGSKELFSLMIKEIHNSNKIIRQRAVEILGELGDTKAVGDLIKKLDDEDEQVCELAKKALNKFGEKGERALLTYEKNKKKKLHDDLEIIKNNNDVSKILKIWKDVSDEWEIVADSMLDIASNLVTKNDFDSVLRILVELGRLLTTSAIPLSGQREFGIPIPPGQSFIYIATFLYVGDNRSKNLLENYEKQISDIQNDEQRLEYVAYLGWTYCICSQSDIGMEKFEEALSIAGSLSSPPKVCSSIVTIANIMNNCGMNEKAIDVLDMAVGKKHDWSDTTFRNRDGNISVNSALHHDITMDWTEKLEGHINKTHQSIKKSQNKNQPYLGYLLLERKQNKILSKITSKAFKELMHDIKNSIKKDHRYDTVLIIFATAASIYDLIRNN